SSTTVDGSQGYVSTASYAAPASGSSTTTLAVTGNKDVTETHHSSASLAADGGTVADATSTSTADDRYTSRSVIETAGMPMNQTLTQTSTSQDPCVSTGRSLQVRPAGSTTTLTTSTSGATGFDTHSVSASEVVSWSTGDQTTWNTDSASTSYTMQNATTPQQVA